MVEGRRATEMQQETAKPASPWSSSLPLVVGWMVVFVAVLGHLPALRGFFAQDDWSFLSRGLGAVDLHGVPARPFSALLYWKITAPWFGVWAPPYHVLSLLLAACLALLTARLAVQLGLGAIGAAVAGLVVAASPVYTLAIFWVSATGELLAAVFAVAALSLWIQGGRARAVAVACALLSFASKEGGWSLPIWMWLLSAGHERSRRREVAGLSLLAVASAFFLWNTQHWIPHGPESPYAVGGPDVVVRNLMHLGSWLVSPLPSWTPEHALGAGVGALFWLAWVGLGWWSLRRLPSDRRWIPLGAALWALLSVLPVLPLKDHLYAYYLTSTVPAWGIALGCWAADSRAARSVDEVTRDRLRASFVLGSLLLTGISWTATHHQLMARDEDGILRDPIVRRSSVAAEAKRLIDTLPLRGSPMLAVLQATRMELPEGVELPDGEFVASTELFGALQGTRGLGLLVPEGTDVRWRSHLDGLPRGSVVLLDSGGPSFRPLGQLDNARMYSALIAISAGQYSRGRHDLWNVVTQSSKQIRFVYEKGNLPIRESDLKLEASEFVRYVLETPASATRGAILDLFAQLYEAVLREKLVETPWDDTLRADEVGDDG